MEEMEELYEAALLDPSLRPEAIKALKDAAGGLGASDISEGDLNLMNCLYAMADDLQYLGSKLPE